MQYWRSVIKVKCYCHNIMCWGPKKIEGKWAVEVDGWGQESRYNSLECKTEVYWVQMRLQRGWQKEGYDEGGRSVIGLKECHYVSLMASQLDWALPVGQTLLPDRDRRQERALMMSKVNTMELCQFHMVKICLTGYALTGQSLQTTPTEVSTGSTMVVGS